MHQYEGYHGSLKPLVPHTGKFIPNRGHGTVGFDGTTEEKENLKKV